MNAFVKSVTTIHTGGNCHTDLVELHDGRVLGVTGESVVLYPSREAFDDGELDHSSWPILYLF